MQKGYVVMFKLVVETIWQDLLKDKCEVPPRRAIEGALTKNVWSPPSDAHWTTPLQYALEQRKKYAFKALLESGANPDYFLKSKQTVTFECALLHDSYWLREVLNHGADPNLWTKTHRNNSATPLAATFCYNTGSPRSVENALLLINAGARLNDTITLRENPLTIFAMHDGWKVVLYLLEKGADPHVGPEANVFFTHLQNPGDYLSKDPDFQAVQAKLVEMNLDVLKAKWNGNTWDIPKLLP
jgi:ankyrin repeat protein